MKTGNPINFKGFGFRNSAFAELIEIESQEVVKKKKDHMK